MKNQLTKDISQNILNSNCPACGNISYRSRLAVKGYDIYKCQACRLEFTWPMPDARILKEFYTRYSDIRADERVLHINAKSNIAYLAKYGLNKETTLLDYGSGKGCFVAESGSSNWHNYDPFTTDQNRDILQKERFDWVTAWGVLEHLTEPVKLAAELANLLVPGGYFAGTTVSTELNIPFQYKPPEHVTYWTETAIEALLADQGLELIEYRQYYMQQLSDIYMTIILRTVPERYRRGITAELPDFVEIPTNEVFFVARKKS